MTLRLPLVSLLKGNKDYGLQHCSNLAQRRPPKIWLAQKESFFCFRGVFGMRTWRLCWKSRPPANHKSVVESCYATLVQRHSAHNESLNLCFWGCDSTMRMRAHFSISSWMAVRKSS